MITFAYNPEKDKESMRFFFEVLPFVLPCKFCRANLVEHYKQLPLEKGLESRETLTKWLYDIHNLVNKKLEKKEKIPSFRQVKEHYEQRLAYGCSKTFFPGWEFLFSIIESHPLSRSEIPVPFSNAPPRESIDSQDIYELLKWNYLSGPHRFSYVCRFWKLLPSVLPFAEWMSIWKKQLGDCCEKTWQSKESSLKALWKTRKVIEEELDLLNRTSFNDLCKMLRYHKSGCAYSKVSKTCRRLRASTRKHKRE